ncbi:MAG: hypothetical protein ACYDH3_01575 [Candidatus Aminicenantales bacterium]
MKASAILFLIFSTAGFFRPPSEGKPYLGQTPPGTEPVIFAPGVISKGNIHSRLVISPDGREIFWNTVDMKTFSAQILSVECVDGKWTDPQPPSFAREGDTQSPLFSPDGKRLYFNLNSGAGWTVKYVEKTKEGWSASRNDGFLWNGSSSFTKTGRAAFSAGMKTKVWDTGIFEAGFTTDGYFDIEPLPEIINVPKAIDYTPFLAPDGSYLLFASNRPLIGDKEELYIHISFRNADGTWSAPGKMIQIQARFPSLSPDGKYLFFCGDDGNIYWVNAKIIETFRPVSTGPA